MSKGQERQFKVKGGETSPFNPSKTSKNKSHGSSASNWGLEHLNWLHIHFELGCSWEELFSAETRLPQPGKIATYLERRLGADWKWICDTDHDDSLSIYAFFQSLANERRLDDNWWTSTHASSHPDSASSSDPISPQQNPQGILSRQGVTTIEEARESICLSRWSGSFQLKRQKPADWTSEREITPTPPHVGPKSQPPTPGLISRKRSHGSTPSPRRQPDHMFTSHGQDERTPLSCHQGEGLPPPSPHTPTPHVTRDSGEHWEVEYGPGFREAAKDQQLRRLVEEEEEEEEEAQKRLLQAEEPLQDEEEEEARASPDRASEAVSNNKPEKEVETVGSAFLRVLKDAMKNTAKGDDVNEKMLHAQNLVMHVGTSERRKIQINGVSMVAEPDLSLFCAFGEAGQQKTISVVLEFKKRKHMRAPSRILGQECAELLGAVSLEKESLERRVKEKKRAIEGDRKYTSYLISWHGLMAYVTRLDVTHKYLEQLDRDSSCVQRIKPLPRVRRSRLLNLTKTQDRIDLAIIAARVAIEQLSQYKRNTESGLIKRLVA